MQLSAQILDSLSQDAKQSPRLRLNHDLRTSSQDSSQRMMNALEPGTQIPIHRHTSTSEVVVVLRGAIRQNFYDDDAQIIDSHIVRAGSDCPIINVPMGSWHNSESLESGTIIFEAKDGAFEPLREEDTLRKP